jgi:hypothetical protein
MKSKYIRAIGIDLGPASSFVSDRHNLLMNEDTAWRKTT